MNVWTRRAWLAQAVTELPDIRTVTPDLRVPPLEEGRPAAGRRVRVGSRELYHVLYLPADWSPRRRYPVIVEYAGNGNYRNAYGDESRGVPEGSHLGYGLSGGRGYLWLCLPYVNGAGRNETMWWGDADATTAYCRREVERVCREYGGDRKRVLLAGFSRGAIGCSYLGLRDEATARLWKAFFAYSHFDGVREWTGYEGGDRASALVRLRRLRGRRVFVSHEGSVEATRKFVTEARVKGRFTFARLAFRNHNDEWVLRDVPERRLARMWLRAAV